MLSPDYISALPDEVIKYWQEVEDYAIQDIARRIGKMGEVTGTAEVQRLVLENLGADLAETNNKISEALNKTEAEVEALFRDAAAKNQRDYDRLSELTGRPLDKAVINQITQSAINTAKDDINNIVGTMGFITYNGQFSLFDQAYRRQLSFASLQVASGVTSYNQAVRETLRLFAGKGMMIEHPSGQRRTVETAIRLCITSGVGRMAKDIAEQNGRLLGADGVEISAHPDSAPDHEPYQGRQYAKADFEALDNTLDRPFEIWNCRHIVYPVILGLSDPVYTEEQLQDMAAKNAEGITYDGKHYTMYEATQMQRQIERTIRQLKRELIGAGAAHDKELLMNKSVRLRVIRNKYEEFSRAAGLPLQNERAQVYGYDRSLSARVVSTEKEVYSEAAKWYNLGSVEANTKAYLKEYSLISFLKDNGVKYVSRISTNEVVVEAQKPVITGMLTHARDNLLYKPDRAEMTIERAQVFVDNAKVITYSPKQKTLKYISEDGYAVLNFDGKLVTAVPQKWRKRYNSFIGDDKKC